MRIISVIEIKDGNVHNIDSFGIFEEQLSQEVVDKAEMLFIEKIRDYGCEAEDDELDEIIGDGYYDGMNFAINLVWSQI